MTKTPLRMAMLFFLLCCVLVSCATPGTGNVQGNTLVFVGVADKALCLEDSIRAALMDAARKVAFFYSASGMMYYEEHRGVFRNTTVVDESFIKDLEEDEVMRYFDKLEYGQIDVFELNNAIFVRARYRPRVSIHIRYKPIKNSVKPWWVDSPGAQTNKMAPYLSAVGVSGAYLSHSDTVRASYREAMLSLIRAFTTIHVIETNEGTFLLATASGTLTGFFVLDTWTDPKTKSVHTLAIARGFTRSDWSK